MFAGLADADPSERERRLRELIAVHLSDDRETYRRRMAELVATLAPAMKGTPREQQQYAWTAVATIVGAVTVARALPPGDEARAVLDAAFTAVMRMAETNPGPGDAADRAVETAH
jgi:TetR/AcrR family transcriptional repressor of nem operon